MRISLEEATFGGRHTDSALPEGKNTSRRKKTSGRGLRGRAD
jgi:hypothetical protein